MLYHEGVFYWYGEHKGGPTLLPGTCAPASPWLLSSTTPACWVRRGGRMYAAGSTCKAATVCRRGNPPSIVHRVDVIGVSCYTSTDLLHWHFEGALLLAHPRWTQPALFAAKCSPCCSWRHPETPPCVGAFSRGEQADSTGKPSH